MLRLQNKGKAMDDYSDELVIKTVTIGFIAIVIVILFASLRNPKPLFSDGFGEYIEINYYKACINNKEFIVYDRGITINLDVDGKPVTCSKKE